jgi:hypothetical protein
MIVIYKMVKTFSNKKSHNTTKKIHFHEATHYQINHWFKHSFEKLGWMILAKDKGYNHKIKDYKDSLIRLKKTIEKKIEETEEKDRIDDLKILHYDVSVLIEFVNHKL